MIPFLNLFICCAVLMICWRAQRLISFLGMATFSLLTIGQSIFVSFSCLATELSCRVLYDHFSGAGVQQANFLLLISLILVAVISVFSPFAKDRELDTRQIRFANLSVTMQVCYIVIILFLSIILLHFSGGIGAILTATRPTAVAGASAVLVALMSIRWAAVRMMAQGTLPAGGYLLILSLPVFIFALGGSRVLVIHYVIPLVIAYFLGRRSALSASNLLALVFIGSSIIFGVQAMKLSQGTGISFFAGLYQTFMEFYTTNVEGFSGIVPGIERLMGSASSRQLDYGGGVLAGIQNIIPYNLRPSWLTGLMSDVSSVSSNTTSVVLPGPASVFWGAGFAGVLAIPIWYLLLEYIDSKSKISKDPQYTANIIVLGAYVAIWPRGSSQVLLVFFTADVLVGSLMKFLEAITDDFSACTAQAKKRRYGK